MRITFVVPTLSHSGGISVVLRYAKHLSSTGHHVTIIVNTHTQTTWRQTLVNTIGTSRTIHNFVENSDSQGNIPVVRLDRKIWNQYSVRVPDADVIIATWWATAEWISTLPPNKGKKYYFIQGHEVFDFLPIERVRSTYKLPLEKIVVSQWLSQRIGEEDPGSSRVLVHNAVDCLIFRNTRRFRERKFEAGFVFSQAREVKGMDLLRSALLEIIKRKRDVKFVGFGTSPLPEDWQNDIPIEYFTQPTRETIPEIFNSARMWICPSRNEGFGLPVLEAMACGTPVVATPVGWAADGIRTYSNGFLCESVSADDLVTGISYIGSLNEGDWTKLSDASRLSAEQFQWETACRGFAKAIGAF